MCAEDHRIRLSAVQLLGELLYLVADTRYDLPIYIASVLTLFVNRNTFSLT